MKISDIITEAGVYKTDNFADLGNLIKQKQKADSWDDMGKRAIKKDIKPSVRPSLPGSLPIAAPTSPRSSYSSSYNSRPLSVKPDSSSSALNTGVRELFNQGMSPPEIEDYLVFRKKIKRNLARQIIDKELYEPASRPKRANPYGSSVVTLPKTWHQVKKQQNKDDNEDI